MSEKERDRREKKMGSIDAHFHSERLSEGRERLISGPRSQANRYRSKYTSERKEQKKQSSVHSFTSRRRPRAGILLDRVPWIDAAHARSIDTDTHHHRHSPSPPSQLPHAREKERAEQKRRVDVMHARSIRERRRDEEKHRKRKINSEQQSNRLKISITD